MITRRSRCNVRKLTRPSARGVDISNRSLAICQCSCMAVTQVHEPHLPRCDVDCSRDLHRQAHISNNDDTTRRLALAWQWYSDLSPRTIACCGRPAMPHTVHWKRPKRERVAVKVA
eukprot:1114781-Pyramimonas_sp.AAC.2